MKKGIWIKIGLFFLAIFVSLAFFAFAYFKKLYQFTDVFNFFKLKEETIAITDSIQTEEICADCVSRVLDGVLVPKGRENLYPAAVVIDNYIDARPQLGLSRAKIVYEAETEGGVTRYLAIFLPQDEDAEKTIGPVRSLRPYFLDWASEFSALLVHVGGSPEALVQLARDNVFNLNQFYKSEYFSRDQEKYAPHNVFLTIKNINAYLESKNAQEGKFLGWKFKDEENPAQGQLGENIKINYINGYEVEWKYNKDENNYARYLANEAHNDNEEQIKAKNIIIQRVEGKIADEEKRLKIKTLGSGEAHICADGKCQEAIWRKKTKSSRARFYNEKTQAEIEFNPGNIWINVVRPHYEVMISAKTQKQ